MLETMDAMFLDYMGKVIKMNTSEIFLVSNESWRNVRKQNEGKV